MKDVDHDASWMALLNEVCLLDAHAPNCAVIERDEDVERRLSSIGGTEHVCGWDEKVGGCLSRCR